MSDRVSWRYDATTQPWLRGLFLVGCGLLYGVPVLVLGAVTVLLGLLLWTGSWELRLLIGLFALVGGPLSLLYLLPMLRDPDQRPTFSPESVERTLSTRAKAVLGVGGASLLGVAWAVDPRLAGGLVAVGLLAGVAYAISATRGTLDPETATLRDRERTFDLSRVTGYRRRRLGPLALVTLSIPTRPGRFGGAPSRVLVPGERLDEVTAALDAVVAANADREVEGREPNPAVRWVAAALALGFVAAGVGGVVLVGAGVGWYVAALCGLFAVVFLFVAREG
ncbi:hypothetical protein [Halorarius litoreus]|uniref:hypothetical protein n=1 Tax=Halorarius litoreus TaxID=2962676 RepID=UPI0020CF9C73|nr:hypothetical protein [Halorarius litoreus]